MEISHCHNEYNYNKNYANGLECSHLTLDNKNVNYVSEKYIFDEKNILGEGHFGAVFFAKSKESKIFYALKISKNHSVELINESKLLKSLKNVKGVPIIFGGSNHENKNVIIETLMGPSIENLHFFCNNKFSESTVLLIALNLIKILKNIHEIGIIHRDLKPSNICFGHFSGNNNKFIKSLNIIDFGLAKRFTPKNFRNAKPKNIGHFVGSYFFASTSALMGIEQYPKDEMESIFYIMAFLKNGSLPWIKNKVKDLNIFKQEIIKSREETYSDLLFKGFSKEIVFMYKILKIASPYEKIDYDMFISIFENLLKKINKSNSLSNIKYDWEIKLKKIYENYKKLKIDREELLKVAFLKRGYDFGLDEFLEYFKN